jgi:hypothetical protein
MVTLAMVMCVNTSAVIRTCHPEKSTKPWIIQFNTASNNSDWGNNMQDFLTN